MSKMMAEHFSEQERTWGILYGRISAALKQFGTEDHFGDADYLLVGDNYSWKRHTIEIHKLRMLNPSLVEMLQESLHDFKDWEIVLAVDVPGTETAWPRMGLTIRAQEVVDDLKREYLPSEFQSVRFG
jgi:hypothetical protein